MHIKFCGAAQEVTGSCHLLETNKTKILVDCGMFQGSDFNEGKNSDAFPFDPHGVDAVLVTHAHLDHVGRIPKLVKEGFNKKIFATKATCELILLIWHDAYEIMSYNHRKFQTPLLFDTTDIAAAAELLHGIDYHEEIDLGGDVKAVFKDAGHIFGSAFIEIQAEGKVIVFSGDIGNVNEPIVRDTEYLSHADLLVCESTYGNRFHEHLNVRKNLVLNLFQEAYKRKGTLMIPAFSLERTQELLYELNKLSEHDHKLPPMPIYLDSPLAIDAMKVYEKYTDYYDMEAARLRVSGDDFLDFPQLHVTRTKEESMEINNVRGPKVVIAGAGMMNGGRVLHHAKRYLSDPDSTLFIIGYQAHGTLGRKLLDGEKNVNIHGEHVHVACHVEAVGAMSAHGDQEKLVEWIGDGIGAPAKVCFVHGEFAAAEELANKVEQKYNVQTFIPKFGESVEI